MAYDFDLFVIGGGSGGVRAARIAGGYGAKVGVAEEYRFGGTCVIRGCVPKKLLVMASHFAEDFEDAQGFGWSVGEPKFSWENLISAKDKEITRLEGAYQNTLKNAGAQMFAERAVIAAPHRLRLASGKEITAERILIATGGHPVKPSHVPGMELAITSNEAFHLEKLPGRVVILGGGYIAVEFAGIFHGLGAEVDLIYRGEEILRGFDGDVRKFLHQELVKKGIRIATGTNITGIRKEDGALRVTLTDGREIHADQVLVATGRKPYTEGLGLEQAGIALTSDGAIAVNEYSQTSCPSVFAVGDVVNRLALTPIAIQEGHAFADTVYGGRPRTISHRNVATAVFSQPPVGTVGLSEEEALKTGHKLDLYIADFKPMKHTLSGRSERTLMKLVVDAQNGKVLGCHMVGMDAPEIIQMAGIAIKMGATKDDFDATVAVHPTAAEEFVTMRTKSRSAG